MVMHPIVSFFEDFDELPVFLDEFFKRRRIFEHLWFFVLP